MSLSCPRDRSALEPQTYEAKIEIDACPTCRGVWLDQGELEAIGARTIEEQKKLDAYLTQATETIRTKILELEQKLQSETADVTAHKARLAAQVEAASASCAREVARLQIERDRLQEICSTFIVERRG
ncbi:MAG: zf-TFIIB domain-containing protein [Gemmatimonadaceae bacterium]|nr:zf-TFIIB domain-containing protein [Gemmatimonadaceae bacterium]